MKEICAELNLIMDQSNMERKGIVMSLEIKSFAILHILRSIFRRSCLFDLSNTSRWEPLE
jgi:hypothetical protein